MRPPQRGQVLVRRARCAGGSTPRSLRPRPLSEVAGGYLVRIADASSYQHQDDDRYESGRTGFGSGTILLVADPETGEPRAYGWFGLYSRWVLETSIAFGRITR